VRHFCDSSTTNIDPYIISVFFLLRTTTCLSHGRQETLSVEEAGHPESVRTTIETPRVELRVPLDELGEPESEGARFPRDLHVTVIVQDLPRARCFRRAINSRLG